MILMLNRQTVLNDSLEMLGIKVAARFGVPPQNIRAKWGEVNGDAVPMFTVLSEGGDNVEPEAVYGQCIDLYKEAGMNIGKMLRGLELTRAEVQEENKKEGDQEKA